MEICQLLLCWEWCKKTLTKMKEYHTRAFKSSAISSFHNYGHRLENVRDIFTLAVGCIGIISWNVVNVEDILLHREAYLKANEVLAFSLRHTGRTLHRYHASHYCHVETLRLSKQIYNFTFSFQCLMDTHCDLIRNRQAQFRLGNFTSVYVAMFLLLKCYKFV